MPAVLPRTCAPSACPRPPLSHLHPFASQPRLQAQGGHSTILRVSPRPLHQERLCARMHSLFGHARLTLLIQRQTKFSHRDYSRKSHRVRRNRCFFRSAITGASSPAEGAHPPLSHAELTLWLCLACQHKNVIQLNTATIQNVTAR